MQKWLIAVLWTVFLLSFGGCRQKIPPPPVLGPMPVTVFEVESRDVPALFESVGTVESSHLVDIRARVEGYLDQIAYQEGTFVTAGTLLFQIDPRPFQAKVNSAKAELERQQAILWDATKIRQRLEPLYKQHAASERDLDNAIADELAAKANVIAAEANLWSAQLNLDYTTIAAPISGITSAANYREGSLITQSLPKPLTTVSAIDPIWVNFSISEGEILNNRKEIATRRVLFPKDLEFDVKLILADNSVYPYIGKVNFAEPSYDQNTGTISVRTTFPNPNALLKPGQFVQVQVLGATYVHAMIVPQRAVIQGNKGPFVYLVNKDNEVEMSMIELGNWWGDYWIISEGLKEGDKVIVDGTNKVQIGSKVTISKTLPQPTQPQ